MSTPVKRELVQPSGNRQRLQLGRQVLLILPPKAPPRTTAEAPEAELELEWVYGYNGRLPKNMHWIPRTGEFLYYTAALGVVMSFDGNSPGAPATQRYFTGHTNEVTCLAYSPEKDLVASGQRDPKGAAKPPVLLWKPGKDTIRFTISHFEYHEKEVAAVCFSSSGDLIFSMGKDDQSMLAVWQTPQWQKPQGLMAFANAQPERRTLPMAQISAGKTPALYMYPVLLENGDPGFVSLNGNSIKFWSVRRQATASAASSSSNPSGSKGASGGGGARLKGDNRPAVSAAIRSNVGISLESKQATFGKFPPPRRLLCVATEGDLTLGGSFSGLLYCFQGNMCKGAITLSHSVNGSPKGTTPTPVGCCEFLPCGFGWIAGDWLGRLYVRSNESKKWACFTPAEWLGGTEGEELAREPSNLKLSSISAPLPDSPDALGCFFLLGTMTAKLFLIRASIGKQGVQLRLTRVLQAGHTEEVWSIDSHPSQNLLVSAGCHEVRFWDLTKRRALLGSRIVTEARVWSVAFNPSGTLLAGAFEGGVLEVWNFPQLKSFCFKKLTSKTWESLLCLKWSHCGRFLAVGCADLNIYLLELKKQQLAKRENDERVAFVWNLEVKHVLKGCTSSPLCCMFTKDSHFLAANTSDSQILYWSVRDGKRQLSGEGFRDAAWQPPFTNLFSWHTVGVWADPNYDRTDINALCSSCRQDRTAPVAPEDLVALGDDMGHVKLLNFPCPSPDTQAKVYKGHASHVQGISFDYKGERVYSGGGRDRCVMAWRLLRKDALPTEEDKFAHLMNAYKEMGGKGQR